MEGWETLSEGARREPLWGSVYLHCARGRPCPPASLAHSLSAYCPYRWTFGDGEQMLGQFKPPYDESFQVPDPAVAQVLVEHSATHSYAIPGKGGATAPDPDLGQTFPGMTLPGTVPLPHPDPAWVDGLGTLLG